MPFQLGRLPRVAVDEVPGQVLAEQLVQSGGRYIGTAKAKPKPVRPGGKRPGGKKPGMGKGKRGAGTARKEPSKHAHRRRPS